MDPRELKVLIRGAGEQASGVAHRLFRSGLRVAMTEIPAPLAVRRAVSFCEAVWEGSWVVDGVRAVRVCGAPEFDAVIEARAIPLLVDPSLECLAPWAPHVLVDATLAKRNLGIRKGLAPLVIALGPGFTAGIDADLVVETLRGHDLGRLISVGAAAPDTGVPAELSGYGGERVLRAPASGTFEALAAIGKRVEIGQAVGRVGAAELQVRIPGVLRGILRSQTTVSAGLKVGDVDASGDYRRCFTISDKARALGGSVLEGILAGASR